jgi:hypothetical protein
MKLLINRLQVEKWTCRRFLMGGFKTGKNNNDCP